MKKILNILLLITVFMLPSVVLAAGSASGSAPEKVEKGNNVTFTVKVSNVAAWNVKLTGTGATTGCSQTFADVTADAKNTTKTLKITCKTTKEGTITFKATGDITSADGVNSNVAITKTVTVIPPREKETEARLSSLSVAGYNINFDKDKDVYSITVEPSVNSINISAKAISTRATITGIGKKNLSVDGGKYEIICTAENGTKKVYTLNVSVVDKNPIKVTIDEIEYTVVKSAKQLKAPTNTNASSITIQDTKIPAYINDNLNITIIGIKDSSGNIKYATYDNGDYKLYNENKSSELLLYISSKKLDGYEETKVIINDEEYIAYNINDRFKIVYAMNLNTGEYNYYKYDTVDKTFQYFEIENIEKEEVKEPQKCSTNNVSILTIVLAIITVCLAGYIIISKLNKKTVKENI